MSSRRTIKWTNGTQPDMFCEGPSHNKLSHSMGGPWSRPMECRTTVGRGEVDSLFTSLMLTWCWTFDVKMQITLSSSSCCWRWRTFKKSTMCLCLFVCKEHEGEYEIPLCFATLCCMMTNKLPRVMCLKISIPFTSASPWGPVRWCVAPITLICTF